MERVWYFSKSGESWPVIQKPHKGVTIWPKGWVKLLQMVGIPENGISREGGPRVYQECTIFGGGLPS